MGGTMSAWAVYCVIAGYRSVHAHGALPPPSIFIGSGAVFSVLALLAPSQPGLAAALSWSMLVAAAVSGTLTADGTTALPGTTSTTQQSAQGAAS